MRDLNQAVRAALASRSLAWLWAPLTRGRLCILTLHRFSAGAQTDHSGIDLNLLDAILARLRRDRYRLKDLNSVVKALKKGEPLPRRSVVVTVDDGYADLEQGAEVFLRHDCPATVFLTSGFVDGTTWLWWDEIEYCCLHASAGEYRVERGPEVIVLQDAAPEARTSVAEKLFEYCKLLPDPEMRRFIKELSVATGVPLPSRPPDSYAPLTWDKIRSLEAAGLRFAPHTVTHPILARVDDAQAKWEIEESWRRVRQEVKQPIPILAYPNGQVGDFGEREFRIGEAAGLAGAVTMVCKYATMEQFRGSRRDRFSLPRFGQPVDPDGACLTASGFDRLRRRSVTRGRSNNQRVKTAFGSSKQRLKHLTLHSMKHAGMFAAIGAGRWRRRRLAILMYHGVSIEDEHAWDPGLYLSPERFRGSLETIRRSGCTVLPLRDAVNRLYDGSLPDRAVALTFDDGNFDFAHRAVPVLEEFDYPATVFVSTYYSYFQRPVFDPALANILWRGRGRSIPASGLAIGSEPISTAEPEDRAVSWRRIHGFTRQEQMSGEAKHELLAHVAEKLEVDLEAMMASRMFYLMRPDELAVLPPELIDVQLHTHRHRTPRDRDTFLDEIADNRTGLRGALGDEARLDQFCYPSGDYVRDYVPWLEQVGVEVAVTTDSGLASPESHRLLLPRVAVTSGMASVELEAWLTGARKLLPRIH